MKFLRSIRLDDSDTRVFEHAAEPGEWAIPGSFAFLVQESETLSAKRQLAFQSGFLGCESFGWCSLVEISDMSEDEFQSVVDRLADHFVQHYGAPHIAAALPKAREEVSAVVEMCEGESHTILAISREHSEHGVVEKLRVVNPTGASHADLKLWEPVIDSTQ